MSTTPDDEGTSTTRPGKERSRFAAIVGRTTGGLWALMRKGVTLLAVALLVAVGIRAYQSTQGPPLRPWHTTAPDEPSAKEIAKGDWRAYVAAEDRMFAKLHSELARKLEKGDRTPVNRYYDPSMASPAAFGHDWNRSFVLEPAGPPRGVVVMLHGLTDAPYSMLSLAQLYRQHGFVAIVPRMPGHGTVPAGLTREGRTEWKAAMTMAMAEARRRAEDRLPIHLVGYSNGGALALFHVMERVGRGERSEVSHIVLVSPMIEISRFARFAGLAGAPAVLGRFAKAAWLDLLPEFNPFKYNSFPVRAARESFLMTQDLRTAMDGVVRQGRMAQMPPILAFQSVVDDTVDPQGVVRLFDALPANGSELVLFDVNRSNVIAPMLRGAATDWPTRLLEAPPRRYTLTMIGAASGNDASVLARTRGAGASSVQEQPTGLTYPQDVFSLSHIALPFSADDPLYGIHPSGRRVLQLGAIAVRGERNVLVVSQNSLGRLSHNPFHAYMLGRVAAKMGDQ